MSIGQRVPLAYRNLTANRWRLLASILGVALAVILMFTQIGFRNAVLACPQQLLQQLNGDIFLVSAVKDRIGTNDGFPRRRLYQVRGCAGVTAAWPVYMRINGQWKSATDGRVHRIRVLAFDLRHPVFRNPDITKWINELQRRDTVLFDVRSRKKFGQVAGGQQAELSGRKVDVLATFGLGTDVVSWGTVVMSDQNFLRHFPGRHTPAQTLASVAIGVVSVSDGSDPGEVKQRLVRLLPRDVLVMTHAELLEFEMSYWRNQSAVGPIFTLGTVVGFLVGVTICYQILYTDLSQQLPQFATLRAIGYTNAALVRCVLTQGALLGGFAFLPAALVSALLYDLIEELTRLRMDLQPSLLVLVFSLTIGMCLVASFVAVRKVLTSDPAELFK